MQTPSQDQPIVSIGMPVYNGAQTIAHAICSILSQTFRGWELIVVDDGSTDNTFEIAASFDDPRIIVAKGENKGLSTRLNECVSRARGKYFARMDQDDIAYPGRLQYQLEFLLSHPEVDLVGGWVVVFNDQGSAYGARRSPLTHDQICAHPWKGISLAHPTWMGKSDWFLRNQYSTDAPRTQDQDLLLRTYKKSRFATVPEIVLGYREDSLSLSKILLARRDMCKTMVRIACEQHMFMTAALGIIGLVAKGLVDTLAISTGLKYHILRHRATALRDEEEVEWRTVWEQVNVTADRLLADRKCLTDVVQSTTV
jgi:glycosyltransferase involved in cell wall biosynthesis